MEFPLKTFSFPLSSAAYQRSYHKSSCITETGEILYVVSSRTDTGVIGTSLHSVDPITEARKSMELPTVVDDDFCAFELLPFNNGRQVLICTTQMGDAEDFSRFQVANLGTGQSLTDIVVGNGENLSIPDVPKQQLTENTVLLVDSEGQILLVNLVEKTTRSLAIDFDHCGNKFVVGNRLYSYQLESFPKVFTSVDLTDPGKQPEFIQTCPDDSGRFPSSSKYLSSGLNSVTEAGEFLVLYAAKTITETPTYWAPKVGVNRPHSGVLWELWRLDLSTFRWTQLFSFLSTEFERLENFHLARDGRLTILSRSVAQIFSLKIPSLLILATLAAQK